MRIREGGGESPLHNRGGIGGDQSRGGELTEKDGGELRAKHTAVEEGVEWRIGHTAQNRTYTKLNCTQETIALYWCL